MSEFPWVIVLTGHGCLQKGPISRKLIEGTPHRVKDLVVEKAR